MTKREYTAAEFETAMRAIRKPGGNIPKFLRAHYDAPGRTLTTIQLKEAAGYRHHGVINLHYGTLAKRIGRALGNPTVDVSGLVTFQPPEKYSDGLWRLVMSADFARALQRAGWI